MAFHEEPEMAWMSDLDIQIKILWDRYEKAIDKGQYRKASEVLSKIRLLEDGWSEYELFSFSIDEYN